MVTEREKAFADWWAVHRDREKGVASLWLKGLRWGLVFACLTVFSFLFDWHKAAGMWARTHIGGSLGVVMLLGGLMIVVFMAIFYKRHKWEMYEQQYREILSKMADNQASEPAAPGAE